MDATAWALIIALHVYPQPGDPSWIRQADQVWLKIGIGGFSEYNCRRAQYLASSEAKEDKSGRFELRSLSCEPYTGAEKISAP